MDRRPSSTDQEDRIVQWDVDDRAMSAYTRAYVRTMWWARDKSAFEGEQHTLSVARHAQEKGDRPPTRWTRLTRRVSTERVAGMTVWTVRPRREKPVSRVIYLHGGGYIHPLTVDYWRMARALSGAPAEVVVPAYPLAPDATVDDVLPRLLELVSHVSHEDPDLRLVLMGDSAGGALALVLAQQLRDAAGPRLDRVVALCPWLDATLDESTVEDLEPTDPMLAESGLRAAGRWWSGDRSPTDPVVSPLEGVLQGLPPIDVFIGDRDILRPAVESLAERAEKQAAPLHVHEASAMFHVWMTRALPEARRTRRHLVRLIRDLRTPPGPGG